MKAILFLRNNLTFAPVVCCCLIIIKPGMELPWPASGARDFRHQEVTPEVHRCRDCIQIQSFYKQERQSQAARPQIVAQWGGVVWWWTKTDQWGHLLAIFQNCSSCSFTSQNSQTCRTAAGELRQEEWCKSFIYSKEVLNWLQIHSLAPQNQWRNCAHLHTQLLHQKWHN